MKIWTHCIDCLTEVCEPVIRKNTAGGSRRFRIRLVWRKMLTVVQDAAAANPNLQVELILKYMQSAQAAGCFYSVLQRAKRMI